MIDLLKKYPQAKLLETLQLHLHKHDALGRCINHPLVNVIFYEPRMNALYNAQYLQKKDATEKALKAEDWHTFIFLHERPYRLEALMTLIASHDMALNDVAFARTCNIIKETLIDVYSDAEGTYINADIWQDLFARLPKNCRGLHKLPSGSFEIYRGFESALPDTGFSWSLDKSVAEFFAKRFTKAGAVKVKTVTRNDVAYFGSPREANEVVHFSL